MSAGALVSGLYESNDGFKYPIRLQPETLTLTLEGVANAFATGTRTPGAPSAQVSKGRRSKGMNTRLVRIRFTATLPPGYQMNGIIALPVLTPTAFFAYELGTEGTYTLNGTDYNVAFVGKTSEKRG